MLIGISGKMGSGKNLVCTIIQGLTAAKKHNIENPSFEWIKKYYINSIWEQKAFAGKLKQTASLLTGIPVEKFEDQEFKEKELGPEWDRIISSDGKIHLPDDYPDLEYSKLTPRLLLQIIGTECIRDKVHPNAWVNALMSEYKPKDAPYNSLGDLLEDRHNGLLNNPNWVITDTRFPNELKAIKDRGGISIRVNRPYTTVVGGNGIPATFNQNQFHPSETSLDSATFDFVISNDKDIEHLINEVRKILEKLNIV